MRCLLFAIYLVALSTELWCQQDENSTFWSRTNYQIFGSLLIEDEESAWGVGGKAWYFIDNRVGIGPSIAYNSYEQFLNEKFITAGVEGIYLRPLNEKWKVFGSIDIGYGNPIVDVNEFQSVEKSGGYYLNPQIGIFLVSRRNIALMLGVGYLRQPWSFDLVDFNGFITSSDITYNRYRVSFGIVF